MNKFERLPGRIRTRSQTRSNENPNSFGREAKCVRMRARRVPMRSQPRLTKRQMCSDEKLNAFAQHLNAFTRAFKRVWTRKRTFPLASEALLTVILDSFALSVHVRYWFVVYKLPERATFILQWIKQARRQDFGKGATRSTHVPIVMWLSLFMLIKLLIKLLTWILPIAGNNTYIQIKINIETCS